MLQFYFFFQNPYDRIPERRISKPNRRINVLFAGLNVFSSIYEFGQYCFFIAFFARNRVPVSDYFLSQIFFLYEIRPNFAYVLSIEVFIDKIK